MANVYVGRIGHSGALARWCLRMSLARLSLELHHPGEAAGELPPRETGQGNASVLDS